MIRFNRKLGHIYLKCGVAALLALLAYWLLPGTVEEPARRMAAVFMLALALWVSEAIPLFATSLLVLGLVSWWIALPYGEETGWGYEQVFTAFADPVIFLFLGGFILAEAVQRERVDVQMAGLLLRAFGHRPWSILAGVMAITALFSMWMSNTATTAMMIVLVQPLVRQIPEGDRFRRALILSVPFAANIGGIGTPIGTPPNAIALAQLVKLGYPISFLTWMLFAVPLMLGALVAMWLLLLLLFRPETRQLHIRVKERFAMTRRAGVVYTTFLVTAALWITSEWHGAPTAVVALLPAVVLTVTRVIGRAEFNGLEWNILVLIAGGIALGEGMVRSGLNEWIVGLVPAGLSWYALVSSLTVAALIMSNVISHTVAVNVLLPLGLAMGAGLAPEQVRELVVLVAISASFAMALPISTPPNAMAYATGLVSSRDLLLAGGLTGLAALILLVLTGPFVISFFV